MWSGSKGTDLQPPSQVKGGGEPTSWGDQLPTLGWSWFVSIAVLHFYPKDKCFYVLGLDSGSSGQLAHSLKVYLITLNAALLPGNSECGALLRFCRLSTLLHFSWVLYSCHYVRIHFLTSEFVRIPHLLVHSYPGCLCHRWIPKCTFLLTFRRILENERK